jgi:riboflavin synthase
MFTGLIEGKGTLMRIDRQGTDVRMVIQGYPGLRDLTLGESVAVDGACLTVATFQDNLFTVDVSSETLSRTTLGKKQSGDHLNLERALRFGDRLGGHLVSGHIDGLGVLRSRKQDGRSWRLFFTVPSELSRTIIEKGSIAINGISLTVNGCGEGRFDVNIIPHTFAETTIADLQIGDEVNIETDLIGKYVEKLLRGYAATSDEPHQSDRISADFLKKHGFI